MGSLLEILYDVIFQPRQAMQLLAAGRRPWQAAAVFLFSCLLPLAALLFSVKTGSKVNWPAVVKFAGAVILLMGAGLLVLRSAVWNLMAEFLGGQGTARGLFTALGFAQTPLLFLAPLLLLAVWLPPALQGGGIVLALLLVGFWLLYLQLLAIREVHRLSTARAVLVICMPLLLAGVLTIVFFMIIGGLAMQVMLR